MQPAVNQTNNRQAVTLSQDEVRQILRGLYLREKLVDEATLDRAERVLNKLGNESTLTQVLIKLGRVAHAQLLDAIRRQQPPLPIGEILIEMGLIRRPQLLQALKVQDNGNFAQKIGEILVSRRMLREHDLTRVLAAQTGFDSEEPDIADCSRELLEGVSLKVCQRLHFLPLRCVGDTALVAFADPMDQSARTEAARVLGRSIRPVMASSSSLERAWAALRRQRDGKKQTDVTKSLDNNPNGYVNRILKAAVAEGASDIHIEPLKERVRVRFRVDGILREFLDYPLAEHPTVVSRLKIMGEADIAERRRHQDGRIEFEDPETGSVSDLRVSFYVTVHGECVVLRVLNQASKILDIDDIGMAPPILERFKRSALEAPSGVIIVTGPTGSGKTSTLYSCVHYLNNDSTSIITAEDPVEYQLDGISQCTVNPKLGRTFEESLRHIVRQDPDIIVLGEIRDYQSASSAIQAALTGHKVLTTFHTEDSIGGLLRLLNMDIEAFLISSTVVCVIAQRLIRKICPACSRPARPDASDVQLVGWTLADCEDASFHEGAGCEECHFTGYKGRVAVFETLVINEAVREAVLERRTSAQIRKISVESSGLITLLEDGLVKAARGQTTLKEVRRTLPRLSQPRALPELKRLTGNTR